MTYHPIILGIARRSGNASSVPQDGSSTLNAEIRGQVLDRDHHTCQYCGFQSKKYQDVTYLDGNHANHNLDNLATACIFCHQCFDLEKTSQMKSGVLIWLPEMTQHELHHIARAIYVARISQGSMAETAKNAYKTLMSRREEAQNRISTDDPYLLAHVMRDFIGARHYAERAKRLDGIRLFPLDRRIIKEGELEFNQFPQILAYWRSKDGPFGGKPPHMWKTLHTRLPEAA